MDMNILETILNAQNGHAVDQLGGQFGLSRDQTSSAVAALVPALAAGLQRNMSSEGGLAGLVGALSGGRHQQYLENPSTLGSPTTTADGNAILGHVFGSKDVSRQVATRASQQTGIDTSILEQMLPLVAAMAMGGLSRQVNTPGSRIQNPTAAGDSLMSIVSPMLDRNRDGSMIDDVLGSLGGLLGGSGRKS
jgi:hypothetical protein